MPGLVLCWQQTVLSTSATSSKCVTFKVMQYVLQSKLRQSRQLRLPMLLGLLQHFLGQEFDESLLVCYKAVRTASQAQASLFRLVEHSWVMKKHCCGGTECICTHTSQHHRCQVTRNSHHRVSCTIYRNDWTSGPRLCLHSIRECWCK